MCGSVLGSRRSVVEWSHETVLLGERRIADIDIIRCVEALRGVFVVIVGDQGLFDMCVSGSVKVIFIS